MHTTHTNATPHQFVTVLEQLLLHNGCDKYCDARSDAPKRADGGHDHAHARKTPRRRVLGVDPDPPQAPIVHKSY